MTTEAERVSTAERTFLLQRVQPALSGLIDGSLSSLAPLFSVALATHNPRYAFFAGLATAIGAGISMSFSEGLSDTGELTGRGNAFARGGITGLGTFIGGVLHTLPFLIPTYSTALAVAAVVIGLESCCWHTSATGSSRPGSRDRWRRSRSAACSSRG